MDCKQIREYIAADWVGGLSPEARQHASECASCNRYLRDARLLRAGFRLLAEEVPPEASVGFASRLIRRLHEWEEKGARSDFFETVGRRFVYATLVLTLALLLSLVLPTTGPVRGVGAADFLGLQSGNQTSSPDVIGADFMDSRETVPGRMPD